MAGVYDFDKTILAAYHEGANRGVEMVNMAEKRNQFAALQKLRQSAFDLTKDQYDRGIIAQEEFAKAHKAYQDSRKKQKEYNKAIEKERSYVQGMTPLDGSDFWTFETFGTQMPEWMGLRTKPEESYRKRMERAGTAELGVPPEPVYPEISAEMAGYPQLMQLMRGFRSAGIRNESLQDLIYQTYE